MVEDNYTVDGNYGPYRIRYYIQETQTALAFVARQAEGRVAAGDSKGWGLRIDFSFFYLR